MKSSLMACAALGLFAMAPAAGAQETLPLLRVGSEVYSNVTVSAVTATDIYFSHTRGMGNAKLKNLEPGLQKHFHFNATNAAGIERKRREDNAQFRVEIANRKPSTPATQAAERLPDQIADGNGDIVAPRIYARSFRGQRPPQIIIQEWLTPSPDVTGKFVLVDFWATWCGPCRQSIPHLNALQARFRNQLVVIGISDESPAAIRKMTSPPMNYHVGVDPQGRTSKAVGVQAIPHAILIDPKGIVRFEGQPGYLDEPGLERLLAKYAE